MLLYFSVSKNNLDTDCISLYLEAASLYLPSIRRPAHKFRSQQNLGVRIPKLSNFRETKLRKLRKQFRLDLSRGAAQ